MRYLFIAIILSVISPTSLQACLAPRDTDASRERWMQETGGLKVAGRYYEISELTFRRPADANRSGPAEIWYFGRVIGDDGASYETFHRSVDVRYMCEQAEGPRAAATGDFYITKDAETGLFYIRDWDGEYVLSPAGEDLEEAAE